MKNSDVLLLLIIIIVITELLMLIITACHHVMLSFFSAAGHGCRCFAMLLAMIICWSVSTHQPQEHINEVDATCRNRRYSLVPLTWTYEREERIVQEVI